MFYRTGKEWMNPSHACFWKCYKLDKQRSVCIFDHCTGFLSISFHMHFIIPFPFFPQMCLILVPLLLQFSLPRLFPSDTYTYNVVSIIPKHLLDTATRMSSCHLNCPLPTKSKIKPITFPSSIWCLLCLTSILAH